MTDTDIQKTILKIV